MDQHVAPRPGIIYTFYSYKGGVGRSMALANVASLLAESGNRVLIIDWDLEASGIEKYFLNSPSRLLGSRKDTPGVVNLIYAYAADKYLDWRQCLLEASPFGSKNVVHILTSGRDDSDYVSRVQGIDWAHLFAAKNLAGYLEKLREEWKKEFDFILVDSRTGITDVGGICTIYLPDALILLFTTNTQSLNGVIDVLKRARNARDRLPFDRSRLVGIPVPARDETRTQYQEAMEWRRTFARELDEFYQDWLPRNMTSADALELLRIPYVPYWSFGERLPVVEEGTTDPTSLGFAYGVFARLLADRFQWDKDSTDSIKIIDGQELRELRELRAKRTKRSLINFIISLTTTKWSLIIVNFFVLIAVLFWIYSLFTPASVNVVVRMIDPSNEQQIFPGEPEYQLSPDKEVRIQIEPAGNKEFRWWLEPIDFGRFYTDTTGAVTTGAVIVFIPPTETDRQGVVSVCEPDPSANFVCKEDSIRQIQIRTISK